MYCYRTDEYNASEVRNPACLPIITADDLTQCMEEWILNSFMSMIESRVIVSPRLSNRILAEASQRRIINDSKN